MQAAEAVKAEATLQDLHYHHHPEGEKVHLAEAPEVMVLQATQEAEAEHRELMHSENRISVLI